MRLVATLWCVAALACCAVAPASMHRIEVSKPTPAPLPTGCFEFPIVVISPTDKPFPSNRCVQPTGPGENCLKAPTQVDLEVIDRGDGNRTANQINCIDDNATTIYRATAKYRGQSSLGFKKHQYSITLHESAPFLGFPSDKKFVFHGPQIDGSLIRNHLAQWLFRSTGRYSPLTRFMIAYVRDPKTKELEYQGVYLALEKITYGPNRVALAPMSNQCNTTELSGGWAWQLNPLNYGVYSPNVVKDPYWFMFGPGERPVLMFPKPKDLTQTMRDYFVSSETGPLPRLYQSLYDNMTDPDDLERHIDLGSFVDYFLHAEMSQNTDAFRRSTYFFKDRNQPINAGPVWDFNLAYGTGSNEADWRHRIYYFWKRMIVNYKFTSLTIQRWRALRSTVWSDESLDAFIDAAVAPFQRQFAPCFHWYSNKVPCANVKVHGTYEANVERVRQSVKERSKWIDENIGKLYAKMDKALWAQATNIPQYNCGPDSNDDGCLTNPDKYVNAVAFPPVRTPYSGPPCSSPPLEQPSIDPCWLSMGVDPRFCSANGHCPPGPGAKCTCINNKTGPMCNDTTPVTPSSEYVTSSILDTQAKSIQMWGQAAYLLVLVGGVLLALMIAQRRGSRGQATHAERQPIVPKRG